MKLPFLFFMWTLGLLLPLHAIGRTNTTVSVVGDDFYINGKPTYAGRV